MTRAPTTAEVLLCGLAVVAVVGLAGFLASGQAAWLNRSREDAGRALPERTYVVLRVESAGRARSAFAEATADKPPGPPPVTAPPAAVKQAPRLSQPLTQPNSAVNLAAAPRPKLLLPVAIASESVGRAAPPGSPKETDRTTRRAVPTTPLYKGTPRDVGRALLGIDGKQGGDIPPITMEYQRTLGWEGYVKVMQRLGGQFFIFDRRTERFRGLADLRKLDVTPTSDEALRGLSPRLREIQEEDAIVPLMARAQTKFGAGDYALVLLLPLNVDFDIVGGIAKRLAGASIDIKTVARVLGEYERSSAGLRLHVRELVLRDGTTRPVQLSIEL